MELFGLRPARLAFCVIVFSFAMAAPVRAQVSITTESYDTSRTAANLNETILNRSNVNVQQFGKVFSYAVNGAIYAQPLYVPNVLISPLGTTHNVVYVATMNDVVYAFDADTNAGANASPLWSVDFKKPAGVTAVSVAPGGEVEGTFGIEGTPVIDLTSNTMYLVTLTSENGSNVFRIHALDITSGTEKVPPAVISGSVTGNGPESSNGTLVFDPVQHMQRPGLALANGMVFVSFGAFGDDPYHGWIMEYSEQSLQQTGLLCITPNGSRGSIWMSGRAPVVDSNNNVYYITGDGSYDGLTSFADSFVKLATTNPGIAVTDWFTPSDFATLESEDEDLGSSGPLLVPGTNLLLGGGKEGILYVVNTANMGHEWSGNSQIVQSFSVGGSIFSGPAFYNRTNTMGPWFYIWPSGGYLTAYHFNGATLDINPVSQGLVPGPVSSYGGGLAVSANGNTPGTGIVWASMPADPNADDLGSTAGILRAFDANNLGTELWDSQMNAIRDGVGVWAKFRSPLVANGKVYVGSFPDSNLGTPAALVVYGLSPPSSTPTVTSTATFVTADTVTQGNWTSAYGGDGYALANSSQQIPLYATFKVQNDSIWTWASTTTDARALQVPGGGGTAAAWFGVGTFSFAINLTDGKAHQVAVYGVDWDYGGRSETVQVFDAGTGVLLDSQNLSSFSGGSYLVWNISGNVVIEVTSVTGSNAVISGVFFGGSVGGNSESIAASSGTPQSAITNTAFAPLSATVLSGGNPLASALVTFTAPGNGASGSFPGGAISAMATTNAAGVATAPAFTANGTTGGPYAVMATVPGVATPATFLLTNTMAGGSSNSATYLFQDTSTQGNWQSKYGSDGSLIAGVPQQNIPYYASVAVENQQNWTWATNSSDPRALQVPGSSGIAAAWYSSSSFSLDLKLTGGSAHQVALYVLDWDTKGRAETIKVVDGDTGATLDTRNIPGSNTSTTGASFVGGTYLAWNISGHVTITVTCNGGPNAVVSGVFFGGGAQASPTFSSASGTTFAVGAPGTFLVTTTGTPVAALTQTTGTLPGGVSFTDNGNGTATLGGTPMAGTGGTYNLSFMAANGVGTNPVQNFMLTVVSPAAPASTSANNVTFTVGTPGTFTVTTTGTPAAALTKTTGTLPGGVSFTDNGNGTATLGGTPMANTGGVYNLTITASNGVGSPAVQNFTLTVDQAPAITSAASTTFTAGTLGTFTVTAAGFPVPMFGESGSLPGGVMFTDNGNGTATLSGTPATNSSSPYSVTITASNGVSPGATQTFILTVNLQGANPGPAAAFVSADTATQGSWMGVYGGDGYDVADGPQSPAGGQLSYGSYSVQNQTTWMWAASTSDTRGLQADSQGDRIAATWYGNTTFRFDVNLTGTHRVALYVLDWDSKGRGETVTVLDASNPGAPALDSRSIPNANSSSATNTNTTGANFVNGTYLVWNISGHVTITVTANSGPNAVVAGIFFGGAGTITPPPVAAASWVKADTATEGTWMGVYGSQGYSLATGGQNIQNISIPATFTVQSQSNWAWAASTTDTRALQTDSQGDRTAATWYSGNGFSLNLNLADGQTHQVAVYVIDWDNKGRGETISIADANSGKMLDARSIPNTNASSPADTNTTATNFLNGTYLVWNISGSVTLTITPNSGPNAVISAVFLDP